MNISTLAFQVTNQNNNTEHYTQIFSEPTRVYTPETSLESTNDVSTWETTNDVSTWETTNDASTWETTNDASTWETTTNASTWEPTTNDLEVNYAKYDSIDGYSKLVLLFFLIFLKFV